MDKKLLAISGLMLHLLLLLSSCELATSASNFEFDRGEISTDSIDYLALGDSYTIGQSVESGQRWPNQLVNSLKNDGYRVRELKIIAKTGWTTSNLLSAIEAEDLKQYNLVSLLIGVNNQYQGKPFKLFETEFELLIEQAIKLAGSSDRVFVVSIPDYGVTPFGASNSYTIALELDRYNAYMQTRCEELEIPFVDVTSISRVMGNEQGALAPDNLHPSGEQYRRWVDVIYPVVRKLLEQ